VPDCTDHAIHTHTHTHKARAWFCVTVVLRRNVIKPQERFLLVKTRISRGLTCVRKLKCDTSISCSREEVTAVRRSVSVWFATLSHATTKLVLFDLADVRVKLAREYLIAALVCALSLHSAVSNYSWQSIGTQHTILQAAQHTEKFPRVGMGNYASHHLHSKHINRQPIFRHTLCRSAHSP
jgi:hypothetical protein